MNAGEFTFPAASLEDLYKLAQEQLKKDTDGK
jgi:hypothetical protein